MGFTVEPWAREWLENERKKGVRCLEIKVSNGNHYVYRSTSRYDPEKKGAKKVSEYLGSLDEETGFTPKEKDARKRTVVTSILETGTVRALDKAAGDLFDILRDSFPDNYDQLYALALMRCLNRTPMKRASSFWNKFENFRRLRPAMSPHSLSSMLDAVGSDRDAQNRVFSRIDMDCGELVMDLSEFFSSSDSMSFAESGYNPEHSDASQVNIMMVCSTDSGIPVMMHPLPGSVRDVGTICSTVREMGRHDVTLIMDRGFYSQGNVRTLKKSGVRFLMPLKRNNLMYGYVSVNEYDCFDYHRRLIRYGKSEHDGCWLYRFRDEVMATSEERTVFVKYNEGRLTMEEVEERKTVMGQMLILSDLDMEPEEIYLMYKRRDRVEKRFHTFKGTLHADSTYLRDNVSAYGHVFVSFLSMYILARLENIIRNAGMLCKVSVDDVLLEYSKAYAVKTDDGMIDYEIPKKLRELDGELGLNIFPILRS